MAKLPLFGNSYTLDGLAIDCQRSVNMFPEYNENKGGTAPVAMRATPGSRLFCTLPDAPVRGLWDGENRLFAAAGSHIYEIFADGTFTDLGTISHGTLGTGSSPVQILPNNGENGELVIVSPPDLYVHDGLSLVQPTFPGANYTDLVIDAANNLKVTSALLPFTQDDVGSFLVITGGTGFTAGTLSVVSVADEAGTSYTDLVIDATDATKITSAAHPFTAHDVNSTLQFTAGGGFDAVTLKVVAVNSGVATMADVVGAVGSTGGIAAQTFSVATLSGAAGTVGSTGGVADQNFGTVKALTLAYLDGSFWINPPDSKKFYISALNEGKLWDLADFAFKEAYADNIAALLASNEEMIIFGTRTTEVWRAKSSVQPGEFPFERDPGGFMHQGCAAYASPTRLGTGVAWIGSDSLGGPTAWHAQGYVPKRVSTHAQEQAWQKYPTIADAQSYSFVFEGHRMWRIYFPTAGKCWEYDATYSEQSGMPAWHECAYGDGLTMHRGIRHAYSQPAGASVIKREHYIGDWENGNIYIMSSEDLDDAGTAITRLRTLTHLSNEQKIDYYSLFQLDQEVRDPDMTLESAGDRGHTFRTPRTADIISPVDFASRAMWWQLGSDRDRVFRLSSKAAIKQYWTNGYLEMEEGAA